MQDLSIFLLKSIWYGASTDRDMFPILFILYSDGKL